MFMLQRYSFCAEKFPKTINIFLIESLFSALDYKSTPVRDKKFGKRLKEKLVV